MDSLALSVISEVVATPHRQRNKRLELGTKLLLSSIVDFPYFNQDQLRSEFLSLRLSPADVVDHCIPLAAQKIGEDWVNDRLSFACVSVASARLFGVCKLFDQSWESSPRTQVPLNLLLATMDREDHIIGPAVLSNQLRRRGHSVRVHSNATAESLREKLRQDRYHGVLISVATSQSLETSEKAIKALRQKGITTFFALGGCAVEQAKLQANDTEADLVTSDIDKVIDAITRTFVTVGVPE